MQRDELLSYLNELLNVERFNDYAPNGLQVEGGEDIKTIITGVTACQALLDEAVKREADCILVHHGYFWKGEEPRIISMKKRRLKTLLTHNINLIAYHLPLDAHPTLGNNVQLAQQLELEAIQACDDSKLIWQGRLATPLSAEQFANRINVALDREPLLIAGGDHSIETLAWCTGGAPDYIEAAKQFNVDAYLTGEVAERTTHSARELGVHFYAAGHHATERYGIKALGEHLAREFDFDVEFIDIDNPV